MSFDRTRDESLVKNVKARRVEHGTGVKGLNPGGFNQSISVSNFTDKPVYIKTQGNAPFVIAPLSGKIAGSIPSPHLEIRINSGVRTQQDFAATIEHVNQIVVENEPMSFEGRSLADKLRNAIERTPVLNRHNGIEDGHIFIVPERDISSKGFFFIRECNLLLSFSSSVALEHNPQSSEAWTAPDPRGYQEARQGAGNIIRVIDNDNIRENWYYYSAKQIVEVTAVRDTSRESGVYFSRLTHKEGVNRLETEYMTFDDAEHRLGLYGTREAAMSNGNPEHLLTVEESRYKAESERLRKEIENLRQEAEKLKYASEQQRLFQESEISRIKHEAVIQKENIEMTAVERKDVYEERSLGRKDKFDKHEKKRKQKQEEASFIMKTAEGIVKMAPLFLTAATAFGIGVVISRTRDKKDFTQGFTNHQGFELPSIRSHGIETNPFVTYDEAYDEEGEHVIVENFKI